MLDLEGSPDPGRFRVRDQQPQDLWPDPGLLRGDSDHQVMEFFCTVFPVRTRGQGPMAVVDHQSAIAIRLSQAKATQRKNQVAREEM